MTGIGLSGLVPHDCSDPSRGEELDVIDGLAASAHTRSLAH